MVLDDVGELITIPILLYIIIQIRLYIATISVKFWLVWALLLVWSRFFGGVDVGDLPIHRHALISPRQLFRRVCVVVVEQILILQGLWELRRARLGWAGLQGLRVVVLLLVVIACQPLLAAIPSQSNNVSA